MELKKKPNVTVTLELSADVYDAFYYIGIMVQEKPEDIMIQMLSDQTPRIGRLARQVMEEEV